MNIKTREQIRQDIYTKLSNMLPELDLTEGTPERDMFIESQIAGALGPIWDEISYTSKLHAPITYYEDLLEEDINNFCATFSVTPRPSTQATGTVTLYTYTEPPDTIDITNGTIVNTGGAIPVEFEIDGDYSIPYATRNSYYNATNERWEIECNVKSVNAGSEYRAGTGTITRIQTAISGIEGVINAAPVTGGTDAETIASRLSRVVTKFQGRDMGPTAGLENFILVYADAVNTVGANNVLMERDQGLGGMIDFYIIGSDLESTTDEVAITTEGLITGINVSYTSTGIALQSPPASSIISVVKNDVVLSPSYYELVVDTGVYSKSTTANDVVSLTAAGISAVGSFSDGDVVEVSYNYNALLHTIEGQLSSTVNHFHNRDYLLREMIPVTVDVAMRLQVIAGQDFDSIAGSVELEIASFINAIQDEGSVELADVIGVAKNYTGVDNIDITTASLTPTGGGTLTAQGDILLGSNEYPVSGTITITEWTT